MRLMMLRLREHLKTLLYPKHLCRTGVLSLIVGTWLTAFNQGDVILSDDLGVALWAKVALNYLTPFVVANLGLLSGETKIRENDSRENEKTVTMKIHGGY